MLLWGVLCPLHAQQLGDSPAWRALLHFDGQQSRIDSPAFFLHPQGRVEPAMELAATAQRLASEPGLRCRYPARFAFLKEHRPEFSTLSLPACPEFEAWRSKLRPHAATLVFASAYLGNPSSMFGHTFLRLDRGGSPLLAWVVNFSAQTHDPVSMRFAYKGATGGYPGRFGFAPYYEKITEYARLEQRDLWEYPLRLSVAERERLLAHLWEMREVWFDYYFFQENCSFQLLALLQSVWPEKSLTEGFKLFAAPVDTLRRLQRTGVLGEPVWRPAAPTALRLRIEALSPGDRQWLQGSFQQRQLHAAPVVSNTAIDVLIELSEFRLRTGDDNAWRALRRSALQMRSQRPGAEALASFHGASPDQSHFSQRAGLFWRRQAGHSEALLSWRPVLHDALDGAMGWPRGGEISVLDTRMVLAHDRLSLDQLTVFSVAALPLRDQWFQPLSWQLGGGFWRDPWDSVGYLRAQGGVGVTYGWSRLRSLRHSYLLHGALLVGANNRRALETGLDIKLQGQWHVAWPWLVELQLRRRDGLIDMAHSWWSQLAIGQQWQINQAWALRGQLAFRQRPQDSQFRLGLAHYF